MQASWAERMQSMRRLHCNITVKLHRGLQLAWPWGHLSWLLQQQNAMAATECDGSYRMRWQLQNATAELAVLWYYLSSTQAMAKRTLCNSCSATVDFCSELIRPHLLVFQFILTITYECNAVLTTRTHESTHVANRGSAFQQPCILLIAGYGAIIRCTHRGHSVYASQVLIYDKAV